MLRRSMTISMLALLSASALAADPAAAPQPEAIPELRRSRAVEVDQWRSPVEALWAEEQGLAGALPELPPQRTRSDPPIAHARSLPPEADLLARARLDEHDRLVVTTGGEEKVLTIDPGLQQSLDRILRNYAPPYAAVVAIEPGTGRVLAMNEYSEAQPKLRGLATAALFPAASVFKIVTSAALLEAGIGGDTRQCYHGGKRRLTPEHLVDSPRDRRCTTLAAAMGYSTNVVFAKLALKHLTPEKLREWAEAFHFNRPIDFPIPTEMSSARIPEDDFGFATTGAGFGDVFMSPLHGANLAAVAANNGVWRDPVLFEDDVVTTTPGQQVMTAAQAGALEEMMERTITVGTARKIFHERGYRVPGAVGKTGSLADKRPFRDYTWFVGYAPRDNPQVAVAALIVNDYVWRIRAPWLGREAMRLYLAKQPPVEERDDTN